MSGMDNFAANTEHEQQVPTARSIFQSRLSTIYSTNCNTISGSLTSASRLPGQSGSTTDGPGPRCLVMGGLLDPHEEQTGHPSPQSSQRFGRRVGRRPASVGGLSRRLAASSRQSEPQLSALRTVHEPWPEVGEAVEEEGGGPQQQWRPQHLRQHRHG